MIADCRFFCILCIGALLLLAAGKADARDDLANTIGVASAFSGYHFTAQDDLTEAAAGVRQLGSKCIKLWFTKLSEA